MLSTYLIFLAGGLHLAAAHFAINYPYWRGDSFQDPASQWIRPCTSPSIHPKFFRRRQNPNSCSKPLSFLIRILQLTHSASIIGANVNQSISNTNRTNWPLTGGSLLLNVHHPWAFTYVNLGLGGDNTSVFNISLVEGFNQTGNGSFCFPTVVLPQSLTVTEGTNASIQVIQISETGSSLYNVSEPTGHSKSSRTTPVLRMEIS